MARTAKPQVVIPDDLKWDQIKGGIKCKRTLIKLDSRESNYATNSSYIMKFVLPNSRLVDLRRGCLDVNVKIENLGPPATYFRLSQGADCIIDRFTIKTNQLVEDVRDYPIIAALHHEAIVEPNIQDTFGYSLYGYGTKTMRNQWAQQEKQYILPIHSSYLASGLIPTKAIHQDVTLEFYLSSPTNVIESDGQGPFVITIRDAELHYDEIELADDVEARIIGAIESQGLSVSGKAYEVYNFALKSLKEQIQINHRTDAISSIINIMRRDDVLSRMDVDDKYVNWYRYFLNQFNLKIDGRLFPNEPINAGADSVEAYVEYVKWIDRWHVNGPKVTPTRINIYSFLNSKFLAVVDLTQYPGDNLVNNFSSKNMHANMILDLSFDQVPASTIRLSTIVEYTIIYTIKDGKLTSTF
jgi:hypothetical protein